MKQQVYNPYLSLDEFICEGELHVFVDKLYIFGSHESEGGDSFRETTAVIDTTQVRLFIYDGLSSPLQIIHKAHDSF
jgi:hypothetical protein